MSRGIVIGFLFIIMGVGLFAYYDYYVRSGRDSREMVTEAKLIFERGDRDSINTSINLFNKVIARYPNSRAEVESYYYIAQGYEKLGLRRLAYLKYLYILKNRNGNTSELDNEIRARMAHLRITKSNTDEGIHQLLSLLNYSTNHDFRSRVYTELGHTYLNMRNYDKSKRMYDIALYENGSNEDAILGKARSFKLMGNPNASYDLYEYFLRYYGGFSQYADDVSKSYLQQVYESGYHSYMTGRYRESISFFNRLLRNYPNSPKSENALYWTGESYYSLGNYNRAIDCFTNVLSNGYINKDQDARIKRGYTYFQSKRYDLAAREFQIYLDTYPHGRHVNSARRWKEMSTRELLYKIKDRMLPEVEEEERESPEAEPEKSMSGDRSYEKENIAEM
jgi:tetratricopeptide (TPR) repeat protein